MSLRLVAAMLALVARGADAQPTDLFSCIGSRTGPQPYCRGSAVGAVFDIACGETFEIFAGRVAWYPLRCVGPVTIEINARASLANLYPLYVEIVPEGSRPCIDPGYLVMVARGGFDCGHWESLPYPVDITRFVPLGSTYAIQVVFFDAWQVSSESPALDCIRVTSHPVSVAPTTWGLVKALFR